MGRSKSHRRVNLVRCDLCGDRVDPKTVTIRRTYDGKMSVRTCPECRRDLRNQERRMPFDLALGVALPRSR